MVIVINGQLSKDVNMKKLNFKTLLFRIVNNKYFLKEVKGYQIDSVAAVYRDKPYWYVIEIASGLSICKGRTKQAAIEEYQISKEKIKNAHKTDVYKHLKKCFEEMKGNN